MNISPACQPRSRHKDQPFQDSDQFTISRECAVCFLTVIFCLFTFLHLFAYSFPAMDIKPPGCERNVAAVTWRMKTLKQKVAICRPAGGEVKQNIGLMIMLNQQKLRACALEVFTVIYHWILLRNCLIIAIIKMKLLNKCMVYVSIIYCTHCPSEWKMSMYCLRVKGSRKKRNTVVTFLF